MPLQKQLVPIQLGQGIDTKTDPKVLQAPKLLALENGVFSKIKRISKRYGLSKLDPSILGGGSISAADTLTSFRNELLVRSNEQIYTRTNAREAWANKGKWTTAAVETTQISRQQSSIGAPDMAQSGNIAVYAWQDSNGALYGSVRDVSNGAVLIADTLLDATGGPHRCAVTPDYLFVYWKQTATNTIYVRSVPLTNPTSFAAAVTVATDAHATIPYIQIEKYGDAFFLIYRTSTPQIKIGIVSQQNPPTSLGAFSGLAQNYPNPVTYAVDPVNGLAADVYFQGDATNDALYLFYADAADVKAVIYPLALTAPSGPYTIEAGINPNGYMTAVSESAGLVRLFYSDGSVRIKSGTITRAGVVASVAIWLRRSIIISKPWRYNGTTYIVVAYLQSTSAGAIQRGFWLLDFAKNTLARISYQNGSSGNFQGLHIVQRSSTTWAMALSKSTSLTAASGSLQANSGVQEAEFEFDIVDLLTRAEINQGAFFSGGALLQYDGARITELGFNLYPEITSAVSIGAGNVTQDCYYVAVYEWTDNQGNFHRSAPSIPYFYASAGGDLVRLTFTSLKITSKTNVAIVIYRTDGVAGNYYRVSTISTPTINDPTVDTQTFDDNVADANLRLSALLYTTGGVIDNIPPSVATHVSVYKNRLVLSGCENPTEIWFSKETVPGEGVAFSDLFILRFDQGSGKVHATWQMDDKLIIFKRDAIAVTYGQGPTDTGAQNDFVIPQLIATDVGCRFPKSIVTMPMGLMFKSDKGFYLLDRGLNVSYIGAEVEDFNGLSVTSAQLLEDTNQIRFTHSDGSCLVYNYYFKEWSTFTNYNAVGAVSLSNEYYMARSNGEVNREDSESWLDNGSTYQLRILIPFMALAGVKGFQRVYEIMLLGELRSKHTLSARLRYDYRPQFSEWLKIDTETTLGDAYWGSGAYWGAGPSWGGMIDPVYQFRIRPEQQKCEAIGLELMDYNPEAINGEGFSLTAIALVVGIKGGAYRQPDSKTMEAS